MAAQEANLRDQADDATGQRPLERGEGIWLVVDRPSPNRQSLLVLPFAAAYGEEVFGRQIGHVLQHRMQALAGMTTGHGQLIAMAAGRRRYVSLHHSLPGEQARTCGTGWGAGSVLYGAIALQPTLRWTLILRDVATGQVLFEDTLIGEAEDLLDAPGDVAVAIAEALGFAVDDAQQDRMARRETDRLDALLLYLQAMDMRPQHDVEQSSVEGMRKGLLHALVLDPSFALASNALVADLAAAPTEQAPGEWAAVLRDAGEGGMAAATLLAQTLEEQGQDEQANLLACAILEVEPLHEPALAIAMRLAYHARDFSRARTLVQTLLDVQAEHAGGHEILGNLLAAADRFPGAA